jgi:flagellar biosynthesis/type III secretory pathway protein FliH
MNWNLKQAIQILVQSESNKDWQQGYNAGVKDGKEEGMKLQFTKSNELTEKECNELLTFLIERNMVLCYDAQQDGFRVRKHKP